MLAEHRQKRRVGPRRHRVCDGEQPIAALDVPVPGEVNDHLGLGCQVQRSPCLGALIRRDRREAVRIDGVREQDQLRCRNGARACLVVHLPAHADDAVHEVAHDRSIGLAAQAHRARVARVQMREHGGVAPPDPQQRRRLVKGAEMGVQEHGGAVALRQHARQLPHDSANAGAFDEPDIGETVELFKPGAIARHLREADRRLVPLHARRRRRSGQHRDERTGIRPAVVRAVNYATWAARGGHGTRL